MKSKMRFRHCVIVLIGATLMLFVSCKKDDDNKNGQKNVPVLSTAEVTEIGYTTAVSGGNITDDGGATVTARGVCWNTSIDPTISDSKTIDGVGAGSFTSSITGLEPYTTYYLRAYATSSAGTGYGSVYQFVTLAYPPDAAFTATPTSGIAPLTVSFTDQSANNPTRWQWDFSDSNSSTEQNPEHTFQSAGSYTVQLTVTNSHGSDTEIKTNYIAVTSGGGTGQPCPGTPTVTDIDGNVYNTVLIGDQCWMKENLNTTKDASGNNITRYCYDDNITNCDLYGGLYTWETVMNGAGSSNNNPSGVQGICPTGWHVPSDDEWTQFVDYVVAQGFPDNDVTNGAGNALKSCRQVNSPLGGDCNTTVHPRWNSQCTHYGFDEFGFSAFPGGGRITNGTFYNIGIIVVWWSTTEYSSTIAWHRSMHCSVGLVGHGSSDEGYGFSVRCLRD